MTLPYNGVCDKPQFLTMIAKMRSMWYNGFI